MHTTLDPSTSSGHGTGAAAVVGIWWVHPTSKGEARFDLLHRPRMVLGRGPDCDHLLDGSSVSRHHAEIRREGSRLRVRDLGSKNGVFVNGQPCAESNVAPGDVLRLGQHVGVIAPAARNPIEGQAYRRLPGGVLAGPQFQSLLDPLQRVAPTDLSILIVGDTGTGKEMVARLVHAASGRRGSFFGLNCAALPESLAEAELFGHSKGAFTGADRRRDGHFREADGGTLFLDEVADLGLAVQAKLLRVLEERAVCPLGESRAVPVDARVVVASQRPLDEAVAQGKFRPDLFARLAGFVVTLPPLRERALEVPFLFHHFLEAQTDGRPPELTPRFVETLCLHPWPFNVRQLVQVTRRLVALYPDERKLRRRHLAEAIGAPPSGAGVALATGRDLKPALLEAVRACGGNISKAASAIGISRGRAYRLLEPDDLERLRQV